jgi:23S rRNA (cytosine1962-C5)-methyltransferase
MYPRIVLNKNEERRINLGHQWIFSNEISIADDGIANGDIVEIYTHQNKFIGRGFYNKNSLIAFRLLTRNKKEIDREFILARIKNADNFRKRIFRNRDSYRMVFSESDFLPGLIIDKFTDKYSIQIHSLGMEKYKNIIKDILIDEYNASFIIEKNDNRLREYEGLERKEGILYGENEIFEIEIDGIKYNIDLCEGQKTGFYFDQVNNRKILSEYCTTDNKVLDLFCNEGGFALSAAKAGMDIITAVDSSSRCIEIAKKNFENNNFKEINFLCMDVFDLLKNNITNEIKFDIIILDPSSFTKSKKNIHTAESGYEELNHKAMQIINRNGILFTFTCSYHISAESFKKIIMKSAQKAKRNIQIIKKLTASEDHPVLPAMQETEYLKGYVLRII